MIENYNESVETTRSPNWSYIQNHPYRVLVIGGLG